MTETVLSREELIESWARWGISVELGPGDVTVELHDEVLELSTDVGFRVSRGGIKGQIHSVTTTMTDDSLMAPVSVEIPLERQSSTVHRLGRQPETLALRPGDAYVVDYHVPVVTEGLSHSGSAIVLEVDRSAITSALGGPVPTLAAIPAGSPLTAVLTALLRESMQARDSIRPHEAEVVGRTVIDLLGASIRSAQERQRVNPTGRQSLLRTMMADIDQRLNDPALSPPDLAARHHLSLRYVHSLFTDIDTTAAAYIRDRRLRRADQILGDPSQVGVSIAAVAFRCGFEVPGTFVRAYRRHFGTTPSDRRAAAAFVAGSATVTDLTLDPRLGHPQPVEPARGEYVS